jgi:hypothetical protein
MTNVISIRVPPDLKEEMERFKETIHWNREIRQFIREKIDERKKQALLDEVVAFIRQLPEAPEGTAAAMVRDDRARH